MPAFEVDFDIAASAGWCSAIAGLLAGFALLYILFHLDHETAGSDETDIGIGGGIITVSPGTGDRGTFAPPLDKAGNSVKDQPVAPACTMSSASPNTSTGCAP